MRPDEIGQAAGFGGVAHRVGHAERVFGVGDAGVEQHAVDAELHRDRHVARRADAGVDDHRIVGIVLLEVLQADADVVRIEHALAGADRAAGRHDARRAGLLQPPGDDRVVGRVAQHLKAVGHQPLGRFERGDRIGQQRPLVGQHFELHPIGAGVLQAEQKLAAQPGDADRIVGGEAAGRVGQQRVAAGVDEVEQVVAGRVDQPLAADGDRDALGAAADERLRPSRS